MMAKMTVSMILLMKLYPNQMDQIQNLKAVHPKSSSESLVESVESGSNGSESGSKVSDSSSSESFSLICGFRIETATGMNKYVKEISWQIGQQ